MKIIYPQWLSDVFYMYNINYDQLWRDSMPDDASTEMKMTMWMEALQGFEPEIIMRAAKQCMLKSPTYAPRVGELWFLCNEFAKAARYVEHKSITPPPEEPETEARKSQRTADEEHFARTYKNPHPPSPLLQEYMAKNNMRLDMPVEEAKAWFYALRGKLDEKTKTGKWNHDKQ